MDYATLGIWVLVFEGFVGIVIKLAQLESSRYNN